MQVVMAENGKKELGKGRHQTGSDGAHEERVEGAPFALRKGRTNIEHGCPIVALRRHHLARQGKVLPRHIRRIQSGRVPCSDRGLARRHALLGCRFGVDLGISEARRIGARKGMWAMTGEGKEGKPRWVPLFRQLVQLSRRHGGARAPTSNQPPCGAQGRRLMGPAALCTCPFASPLSQV